MIQRRHSNRIHKLKDSNGLVLSKHQDIQTKLINYFRDLLSEPAPNRQAAITKVIKHIPKLVSDEQNRALMRLISIIEVEAAIKQTPKGKSPGIDGFTAKLFHHCWDLLKEDIWQLIEHSRSTLGIQPAFNATFLALIPKEENSQYPKAFRPIVVCNVIYKLITKIIANTPKPLLPSLILRE